jgi:hypothetical protein
MKTFEIAAPWSPLGGRGVFCLGTSTIDLARDLIIAACISSRGRNMTMLKRRPSLAIATLVLIASSAIRVECAFAFQSPAFDQETLRAIEIETLVLDARRRITSCEAIVEHRSIDGRRKTYKLVCDGPNVRMDYGLSIVVKTDDHIVVRNVSGRSYFPGQIHPSNWNGSMIFDPRQLGITIAPVGVLHSCNGLTDCLATRNRAQSTLTRERRDARDLVHIQTRFHNDFTTDLWIDEQRGPGLVKAEFHTFHKGQSLHDRMTIDLVEVDGAWFPKKVTHQRATNGLFWSADVAELREIRINQGADYQLFTPAGMGFLAGDRLKDSRRTATPSTPLIWNGKELVWPPGEEHG